MALRAIRDHIAHVRDFAFENDIFLPKMTHMTHNLLQMPQMRTLSNRKTSG